MYANPYSMVTCWVTALAIYLASNPQQIHGVFHPGLQQKSKLSKIVGRILQKGGEREKQFGTHSIREGVAMFAFSGCIGGPSIVSVCLLCDWSIDCVQDRYLRYDAAGDQYLGRVVAGRPLNKTNFSVLPPHFSDTAYSLASYAVQLIFPKLSSTNHFSDILMLCLASLVYHAATLTEALTDPHALLSTPIFRNPGLLQSLQERISMKELSWLRSIGVLPHIEMYKHQKQLMKETKSSQRFFSMT